MINTSRKDDQWWQPSPEPYPPKWSDPELWCDVHELGSPGMPPVIESAPADAPLRRRLLGEVA
jgi:hypothetical protein